MSYQQYIEPCTDTPQQVDKPRLEVATSTEKVLKQIFSGKSVPNKIVGEYKVTPIMSYINRELDILSLRENEILAETWNDYLTAAPTPAPRFRLYRELCQVQDKPQPRKFSLSGKSCYDHLHRPCPVPAFRREFGITRLLPQPSKKR
ncbi:uncharacterized protein LOC119683222 [Teleopsis dalmanni]|uniref:uncharacterized protein LOC119683222 n=1 Tax=Teleopsis dalmanni TaxID=139649 RepID=UPI0018CD161D|nr:uncharacterized protein LOC119661838 isoform X1 [Teleopsis dalmanni]XP_037952784.1 uncharacterized protein LOC119683222 [Teleopsis dalmanni]